MADPSSTGEGTREQRADATQSPDRRVLADAVRTLAQMGATPNPDSAATAPAGYEIVSLLGRGGMGVVYKARQTRLDRVVALKMVLLGAHADEKTRERFLIEAKAVAALNHPRIVQVFECGTHVGLPYFALEYCGGGTLAKMLAGQPVAARRAAAIVRELAHATQAAHDHGIIHRDLKPANVLLSGGPDADSHPRPPSSASSEKPTAQVFKITDFGLAKQIEGDSGLTQTGAIIGTPSYMSPEQAAGHAHLIGRPADVYALGGILYECLTGQPPFRERTALETVARVINDDPTPIRRLNAAVPIDLDAIAQKCLEKNPASRYPTALALADDLGRWLSGEPVHARPTGVMGRAAKWVVRRPGWAAAVLCGALALAIVLGLVGYYEIRNSRIELGMAQSEAANERERERTNAAIRQNKIAELQQSRRATPQAGWRKRALEDADTIRALGPGVDLRDGVAGLLDGLDATIVLKLNGPASAVLFDTTGDRLLLGGGNNVEGAPKSGARLVDAKTGAVVALSRQPGEGPVAFRANGNPVHLVPMNRWKLVLWDISEQQPVSEFLLAVGEPPLTVSQDTYPALALTADGTRVAASAKQPNGKWRLLVWDSNGTLLFQRDQRASSLAFAPDGALLAVGGENGEITVLSTTDGKEVVALPGARAAVQSMAFAHNPWMRDGIRENTWLLAAGDWNAGLTVWDLATGGVRCTCHGSEYSVNTVAFSPDNMVLASAGRSSVKLWDTATGRLLLEIPESDEQLGLAFDPRGKRLAVGSPVEPVDFALMIDLEHGRGITNLFGLPGPVEFVRFSADGRWLAALSHELQIAVWDVENGRLKHIFDAPRGEFVDNFAMIFDPTSAQLVCAGSTQAKRWDVMSGRLLDTWTLPPGLQNALAFDPTGRRLLLARNETIDGVQPFNHNLALDHPRFCPVRDLLGQDPLTPIKEIRDFNAFAKSIVMATDATYLAIHGFAKSQKEKSISISVYALPNCSRVWTTDAPRDSVTIKTDSNGKLLTYCTGGPFFVREMPSGILLKTTDSESELQIGDYHFFGSKTLRNADGTDIANFAVQHSSDHNSAARRLATGSYSGRVAIYDPAKLVEILSKFSPER